MRTLNDLKIGDSARVVKIHGSGALRKRLLDMGIAKGADIYVKNTAPLNDPIEVTVRGYELSLRRTEAEQIEIA